MAINNKPTTMNQSSIQALAEKKYPFFEYANEIFNLVVVGERKAFISGFNERIDTEPLIAALKKIEKGCDGMDEETDFSRYASGLARTALASIEVGKQEAGDSPLYTEGICSDGAAILKDGVMLTISEVLVELNRRPSKQEGMRWVKASERLPAWGLPVKWRLGFKERVIKETVEGLFHSRPATIGDYEWLSEPASGEGTEG